MWELDHKHWAPKNCSAFKPWCWRKLLRVPWTARRSNQSILKEINPKYSLEGLILKLQYYGPWWKRKDPDVGEDWRQEEKGTTEDELVGWHHWLSGYEFEQTLKDKWQHSWIACCSPWGCKESDMTEWLNNNNQQTPILNLPKIKWKRNPQTAPISMKAKRTKSSLIQVNLEILE